MTEFVQEFMLEPFNESELRQNPVETKPQDRAGCQKLRPPYLFHLQMAQTVQCIFVMCLPKGSVFLTPFSPYGPQVQQQNWMDQDEANAMSL